MVSGDKSALFGVPSVTEFIGEYFLIPAQGYGIPPSIRVNFHCHVLHPVLCRKHQVGVE